MAEGIKSSIKCRVCGEWSEWNQQPDDVCRHCGALLSDRSTLSAAAREAEQEKKGNVVEIGLIEIYPTDSKLVKFFKRMIQAVQLTFVAILSFIIWFLTLLAG